MASNDSDSAPRIHGDLAQDSIETHTNLSEHEAWWRDHSAVLGRHGYLLRPRFRPGWVPSWTGKDPHLPLAFFEDALEHWNSKNHIMDATRIEDNVTVLVKRVNVNDDELAITRMLSSPELRGDSHNHAVPVLDYFVDENEPNLAFLVMPLLRSFDSPLFRTVGEALDFVQQVLEGLVYLHDHKVAHRNCSNDNLMMDARGLYPQGFHPDFQDKTPDLSGVPKHLRRSDLENPVRYYFVDFSISSWFQRSTPEIPSEGPSRAQKQQCLVVGEESLDRTVPELSDHKPYDPFPVDVFIIGNVIKRALVNKYCNLQFLADLANRMTRTEPERRPSAADALELFKTIVQQRSPFACRWRVKEYDEPLIESIISDAVAATREVKYQLGQAASGCVSS